MTSDETTIPAVGVRPLDEVFDAIETANRRPQPWGGFDHGVLGAYRWATGAQIAAPVTAVAALGATGPCRAQLLAECQAAAVHLRDALEERTDPAYALGTYQALAWLCGHHEDRP
ncbi:MULTISPECIES: hypothetical protein [Streptomycetaceae]|uniref:hypothetical protein n=1 Tax=Streptomycetaceae TaxID=2062 RepID=UPI00093F4ABA|nr:hypothetical protein [Streptomyces sp. CB02056]OKI06393.1 hypothetical protein AMK13_17480 [Streptomyces sp. CB02056]